MRVLQTKVFERFARKNRVNNRALCDAVGIARHGLVDADLGGGLIKQRVARPGQGKSGGFRTIIAFRTSEFACFLYGFAKNDLTNITAKDLANLHDLASRLFNFSSSQLDRAVSDRNLFEVQCDEEALS